MSNKYHRLYAENREVIADMKQAGKTQSEIAQAIGFSQSAMSKELSSNHGERGYRPAQAKRLAKERKSRKRTRPKVMVGIIKDEVEARLRIKHSPDQISKSLALLDLKVSHETIYHYIATDRKAGVEIKVIESISHSTVGLVLKKVRSNPGGRNARVSRPSKTRRS